MTQPSSVQHLLPDQATPIEVTTTEACSKQSVSMTTSNSSTKPICIISSLQHTITTYTRATASAAQQQQQIPLRQIFPRIDPVKKKLISRQQQPPAKVISNVPLCTFTKSQLEKVLDFMERKNLISSSSAIVPKIYPKTNLSSNFVGKLTSNYPSNTVKKQSLQSNLQSSSTVIGKLSSTSTGKMISHLLPGNVSKSNLKTNLQPLVTGKTTSNHLLITSTSNHQETNSTFSTTDSLLSSTDSTLSSTDSTLSSTTTQKPTSNQLSIASAFNLKTNPQFPATATGKLTSNQFSGFSTSNLQKNLTLSSAAPEKATTNHLSSNLSSGANQEAPSKTLPSEPFTDRNVVYTNTSNVGNPCHQIASKIACANTSTIGSTSQPNRNVQLGMSSSQTTCMTTCTNSTFESIPSSSSVADLTTSTGIQITSIQDQSSSMNIIDVFVNKLDDLTDFLQNNYKIVAKGCDTLFKTSNLLLKMEELAKLLEAKHNVEENSSTAKGNTFLRIIIVITTLKILNSS